MQTFTDSTGVEWHIELTLGIAWQAKDTIGDMLAWNETDFGTFLTNPAAKMQLLRLLTDEEMRSRNLSEAEFGTRLNGESIAAAFHAIDEELQVFFRSVGKASFCHVVEELGRIQQKVETDGRIKETIRNRVDQAIEELPAHLASEIGNKSGESAERLASNGAP
jgi:hypothetical protein